MDMRILISSLLGFMAGLVAGYLLILFGWIGYALIAHVGDSDGGKIMSVALLGAPLGGIAAAILGAFWAALRAARRQERLAKPMPSGRLFG